MAIKIIDYTVDISGMTPLTEKDGGTQGDHRVTELKFTLSKELNDAINAQKGDGKAVYRFDIYDGEGGKWSADTTELTGEVVSFELEERHTRYGGKITVYLVLSVLSNDQETEVELYSFPAVLRLKNLPSGVEKTGENYESISSLAEAAKTNSEKAIQSAEAAASSAEKAIESAALSSAEAERAERTLNYRIPKVVNQEMSPFSQTVSIKSNAEYEQINEKWFPKDSDYTYHNIDDGFYNKTSSYAKGFIATRDKTTGNLWTDTPIDDEDCANKKYVDEKTVVDQEFSEQSENAQSGIAIGNVLASLYNRVNEVNKYAVRTDMNLTDNYYTKTEVDEKTIVDQTYNAESENAQSGKAVAEAVSTKIPKVVEYNRMRYPKAVVLTSEASDLEMIDGKPYPKDTAYKHLNIDNGYSKTFSVSSTKGFIATRDKKTGNLWTGTPIDDVDCANKKYVDEALAQSGGASGETWEVISDTTTEFDTPVSQIVINQDTNGNSFSLKKMRVFIDFTVAESYTGIARALTNSATFMYIVTQSFSAGSVYGYFIESEVLPMVNNRCQIINRFNHNRMTENGNVFDFNYNVGSVDYAIRNQMMSTTTLGDNVSSINSFNFLLGSDGKINKARILIFGVRA